MKQHLWVWLWPWLVLGCDDAAQSAADAGGQCLASDLIRQCPPGSNPILGGAASDLCAGAGELRNMQGAVTGQCYGAGSCFVACQFAAPCPCGVDRVTADGVFCTPCAEVNPCGDGQCAAGETPQSCPQDCAGDCAPGDMRCQGVAIESCNLRGRWEAIACPQGEACVQRAEDPTPRCARDDVVVGQDGGVADAGGPRIAGRLLLGDAEYPGTGTAVRPGSGRDLSLRGRFGYLRACHGNDAQQARCREQIGQQPRDELVNQVARSEVVASAPAGAEEVWLWGTAAIVGFSPGGSAPDSGPLPPFEAFCAAHTERCLGRPGECDAAVSQPLYDAWSAGAAGMACWLAAEGCPVANECRLAGRVHGYGDGVTVPRPDAIILADDGATGLVWTDDQHVALYDVATGALQPVGDVGDYERAGGASLAMSADGRFVAATAVTGQTFSDDGLLVVWERAGGPPVAAVPLPDVAPAAVALSPDGSLAAVTRRNTPGNPSIHPEGIDVIDVASGALLFRILPVDEPNPQGLACRGHINYGLAFSPAGDRLAAGAQQINGASCTPTAVVEIWNLATREKELTLTGPPRLGVSQLRYSPDGTTLAVAASVVQAPSPISFDLSLWDTTTGALVQQLESGSVPAITSANGLIYSPDGLRLVTWGAGDGGDDFALSQVSTYGVAP